MAELDGGDAAKAEQLRAAKLAEYVTFCRQSSNEQDIHTMNHFKTNSQVHAQMVASGASKLVPINTLMFIFDWKNFSMLWQEEDGIRKYIKTALTAGLLPDLAITATSAACEWIFSKLEQYCSLEAFNNFPEWLKSTIISREGLAGWEKLGAWGKLADFSKLPAAAYEAACEHPLLTSGLFGLGFGMLISTICDWLRGELSWRSTERNALRCTLAAAMTALLAPFTTTFFGTVICTIIIGILSSLIVAQVTKSQLRGKPATQQIWEGICDVPSYIVSLFSPPPRFETWRVPNEDDVPQVFVCPILFGAMADPALLHGQYYEYRSIVEWVRGRKKDLYRRPCEEADIVRCPKMRVLVHRYANANGWVLEAPA